MTNEAFKLLKTKVLSDLDANLDPLLTYHSRSHTEDVLTHTERIALAENIRDPRLLMLMKVAALFHDTGFVDTYTGHEERSCEIMLEAVKNEDFNESELELMCSMIMATKMPQSPTCLHEMVLCDADLDYLGRDDYPVINKRLRKEWLAFGMIEDLSEWNDLQVKFLATHKYFTKTSLTLREPVQLAHLQQLKNSIEITDRNHTD